MADTVQPQPDPQTAQARALEALQRSLDRRGQGGC